MPAVLATVSKATIRHSVVGEGGYTPGTTTSGGTAGGIDLIASALIGYGEDLIIDRWFLITSGTNAGKYRRARAFSPATGTVTFANTFGATVATSVTFEIYQFAHMPSIFTNAVNAAIQKLGSGRVPAVYRVVNSHIITNAARNNDASDFYATPRNMRNVFRISHVGNLVDQDLFDRANSTSTPGGQWTEQVGSWGITSERLYGVSNANGDFVMHQQAITDGMIAFTHEGTNTQLLGLTFKVRELYDGSIETIGTGHDLSLRLTGSATDITALPSGTVIATSAQTHTDNVDYNILVSFRGPLIEVWENDVQIISYTLTGTDMEYLQNDRWGFYIDGASAAAATVDNVYAFRATTPYEWGDWKQSGDNLTLEIPAMGRVRPSGILLVEGCAPLSLLADDTTAQTITSDSTATLEIATTDPAYRKLVLQARAELARMLSTDMLPNGELTPQARGYERAAERLEQEAAAIPSMPRPTIVARHGY